MLFCKNMNVFNLKNILNYVLKEINNNRKIYFPWNFLGPIKNIGVDRELN